MTTKEFYIRTWPVEVRTTLNAFAALPEGQLHYRPHPKTRSAREIVEHITAQPGDIIEAFTTGCINHRHKLPFDSMRQAMERYQVQCDEALRLIGTTDEAAWEGKAIPFLIRGKKMREGPLRDVCFAFLFDMIHHRGQLSTYYRPMGTLNPFIYGPTAEMVEKIKAERRNDNPA